MSEEVWKLNRHRVKEGWREMEVSGGSMFERKRMSRLQRVCVALWEGF